MRKLQRTPAYIEAKRALNSSGRVALWFAEDAIRGNPENPGRTWVRYPVPGLDQQVIVVENGDLLIMYHELSSGDVSLDLLIDRKNPPAWYHDD